MNVKEVADSLEVSHVTPFRTSARWCIDCSEISVWMMTQSAPAVGEAVEGKRAR